MTNAPRAPEFNEVGAFANGNPDLTGFQDVFWVRMTAKQPTPAGQSIEFAGDPADDPTLDVVIKNDDPANPAAVPLPDEQVFLRATTLTITAAGSPEFFNAHNPMDVNEDTAVSAIDALTVINVINASGSRPLMGRTPVRGQMVDTNMDGSLSAIDALGVINYLNAFLSSRVPSRSVTVAGGEGEGEASSAGNDLALLSTTDSPSASSTTSSTTSGSTLLATPAASTTATSTSSSNTITAACGQDESCSTSTSTVDAGAADELYAGIAQADSDLKAPLRLR